MDWSSLEGVGTVLAFIAMISIFVWAFSKDRKQDFDEAANLPFADEQNDLDKGHKDG